MVLKAATARNQTTIHFSSGRPSTQLAGDACDEIGDFDDEPTYDAPSLGSNALLPQLSSITLPPREHIGSSSALELSGDSGGALESGGGSDALEPRGGSGALEPGGGSNLHLFLLNFLRNVHLFAIDMKAQDVEEASVLKALSLLRAEVWMRGAMNQVIPAPSRFSEPGTSVSLPGTSDPAGGAAGGDPFRSFQAADDIEDADLHDEDIGQQKRPDQMQHDTRRA
ncbi:hypothetical protein T492DRAFT_892451 [Pavlovales sp. CCMP2436]|nr:hypothetical protein T492DRAFT_892451 [Pavlovales sp. CCMP2436]